MSESTSTTGQDLPPSTPPTDSPQVPDNRGLVRLLWALVAVAIVVMIGFGVFYYMNQKLDSGPTQNERVVATSEQAVRDNPNDVNARLALAGAYLKSNRPDDARAQFDEIIKAEPNNRSALLGIGGILYEKGDLAGAKQQYTGVIDSSRTGEFSGADVILQEAYYYRAMTEMGLKDYPKAVTDLQKALTIDKADADAWNAMGQAQLQAGRPENAADAFNQALLFIPTGWCDPYTGLKAAYQASKNTEGVTYATAMAAICNGDASPEQTQALTTLTTGEFKVPAMLGLAVAAESTSDIEAANKWYREVVKVDPKNIAANSGLSRVAGSSVNHGASATPTPSASGS